jgi:hypothetical protein
MLRSIVEGAVASQPDMRLVGSGEHGSLDEAVERSHADVLIVNAQPDRPESWFHPFLIAHPTLKVFVLTQDGRNATLLQFRRARIADVSPTMLVDAIRSALQFDRTDEHS